MDRYSILDRNDSQPAPEFKNSFAKDSAATATKMVRFPQSEPSPSLAEMAQRDLDATLHLLTERAQYITGASGAAIALREDGAMICRASVGPSAPELGAELQTNSGLTGESVRTRQILRCDDAERDFRVNHESCQALGIKSVMVMPLIRDAEVIGVFELLADRTYAFEARDVTALDRLSEMVLTALEHADAAKRALGEIAARSEEQKPESAPAASEKEEVRKNEIIAKPIDSVRLCAGCGFPVSEGRTMCIDCETARAGERNDVPGFLAEFGGPHKRKNWLQEHFYTIGAVLVAALTVVVLLTRLR